MIIFDVPKNKKLINTWVKCIYSTHSAREIRGGELPSDGGVVISADGGGIATFQFGWGGRNPRCPAFPPPSMERLVK